MPNKEIHDALRRIGLALNMSNNLIVTDNPEAEADETHWKTDHLQEIEDLEYIKNIFINIGIYSECDCCSKKIKGEK